jgi:hypothetical protein
VAEEVVAAFVDEVVMALVLCIRSIHVVAFPPRVSGNEALVVVHTVDVMVLLDHDACIEDVVLRLVFVEGLGAPVDDVMVDDAEDGNARVVVERTEDVGGVAGNSDEEEVVDVVVIDAVDMMILVLEEVLLFVTFYSDPFPDLVEACRVHNLLDRGGEDVEDVIAKGEEEVAPDADAIVVAGAEDGNVDRKDPVLVILAVYQNRGTVADPSSSIHVSLSTSRNYNQKNPK